MIMNTSVTVVWGQVYLFKHTAQGVELPWSAINLLRFI